MFRISFFYLGFLSRTFTNLWTAAEGEGHFFNSSLLGWGAHPQSYDFFSKTSPPIKTDVPPHGVHPHLKMKHPPSEPPPPPTTTTIENLGKICVKKFVFSKFVGLHAYSRQLYYQMNSFTGIFWQHRRAVISESSPLYIKVNREPLVSERKSLTTKLRVL